MNNTSNFYRLEGYFENMNIDFSLSLVILDVDGTLVEDGGTVLSESVLSKLGEIKKRNTVKICSNKNDKKRKKKFEKILGIKYLDSKYKKPDKKIALSFPIKRERVVIVGDKFLTDGLLAFRIKARFIKVKRKRGKKELLTTRLIYFLDDVVFFLFEKHFK